MNKRAIKKNHKGIIRKEGFDFGFDPDACKSCLGHCCRGESGRIWVTQPEISVICSFLNMNTVDFIGRYLHRENNRFSIRERFTGLDFECIFFENRRAQCAIYGVRPVQCRRFPFWHHFKKNKGQVVRECPGIRE